jgi:ectoine hydroxylase-related dioxygenase (phytanoyl-CoA dioxygenase family)
VTLRPLKEIRVKTFHELKPTDLDLVTLRNELEVRGYVLIRNILPKEAVDVALTEVTRVLFEADWLNRTRDPKDRVPMPNAAWGDPDPVFKRVYQQVFNLEELHLLPHQAALRQVMEMIVGEHVLIHPKPIVRLIFPNCERLVTHAHQDYEFMGGDPECYTVWIPLHDCPVEVGPLRILEGSHRNGIRRHEYDNLHVPEISESVMAEDDWVGGAVNAGDLLIFHSLSIHAASPNLSNQMRVSMDCRFQDARRTLNPANLVFAGESGKSWEKTYAGWASDELKYYWKKMSLRLQPSKAELENLADTQGSPKMRAKYARMASQLD